MPTHHLYVSGHNPYHKLLPNPDLPATLVYTPTDVLHPVWRDHARTSYGIEELAGEYVWGGYACSLIRLFDSECRLCVWVGVGVGSAAQGWMNLISYPSSSRVSDEFEPESHSQRSVEPNRLLNRT